MPNLQPSTALYLAIIMVSVVAPTLSASSCPVYCEQCFKDPPTIFTCSKCYTKNSDYIKYTQYMWSCQDLGRNDGLFVGLCVAIVCLHLFMLSMGIGIYSLIYEQIQIVSILMWVAIQYNGVLTLQGTNFAISTQNSFVRTYGVQFIVLVFILSVFFFLVVGTARAPHNPTAVLIRRKRATFPLRVITLTYNMLLFSSLCSVVTIQSMSNIDIFQLFLSILGLLLAAIQFIGIFFLCNFKKFKLDDPNYYAVCEKMLSVRWWVKNKLFFQFTNNTIIICAFVFGFSKPNKSIIVILVSQSIFTLYLIIFIKYAKLRYKILLTISNLIFVSILSMLLALVSTTSTAELNQTQYGSYRTAYTILTIILCIVLMIAEVVEIFAQRYKIGRQLRSFKNRFIVCQKLEKEVEMNKYDSNSYRARVTQFHNNEIYGCDLSGVRKKLNNSMELELE